MGEGRGVYRVWVGKPEGKRYWGDPDIEGRIILDGCLRSRMWGYGLD
jgi:hypothetical protein